MIAVRKGLVRLVTGNTNCCLRKLWLRSIEIDDDTYEFDIVPDADDVVKRDTERPIERERETDRTRETETERGRGRERCKAS